MEVLCSTNEITEDSARRFLFKGFDLIVVHRHGSFYAYRNECPHMYLPLCTRKKGKLSKEQGHLVCMQHGAEFDVENGLCMKGPCQGMELESVNIETRHGKLYLTD